MKILFALLLLTGCTSAQNPYPLSVHFRSVTNTAHILRGPDSSGEIQIGNTAARFTYTAVNCGPAQAAETPGRWFDSDHTQIAVLLRDARSGKMTECVLTVVAE